jgi:hypothetical protein
MKASELRIGNYVRSNDVNMASYFTVTASFLKQNENEMSWFIEEIPLTEEWLLKFGFELDIEDDGYQKRKYKVSVSDEGCLFFINIGYYPEEIAEFKYVHQLQNLYFALTGKELTFKSE